jgi:hypothetical protein
MIRVYRFFAIDALAICLAGQALAQSADPGKIQFIPSTQKYRASGILPATGRSGSADITARALVNKDLSADLEVTTGELDSPTAPPGNIARVQYKPLGDLGQAVSLANWSGLNSGGYFRANVKGLSRGQQAEIQTSVTGIDPNRASIVTLIETAKLRPDLRVLDVDAGKGIEDLPLQINATVVEANRDTGARADCVLYVNSAEADRARGIWVDTGGHVSCQFTHTFTTSGTFAVKVTLENVAPADWDSQDNAKTIYVGIRQPDSNVGYEARVGEGLWDESRRWSHKKYLGSTLVYNDTGESTTKGWGQRAFIGFVSTSQAPVFPISIAFSESSDAAETGISTSFPDRPALPPDRSYNCSTATKTCRTDEIYRLDKGYQFHIYSYSSLDHGTGQMTVYVSGSAARDSAHIVYVTGRYACGYGEYASCAEYDGAYYLAPTQTSLWGGNPFPIGTEQHLVLVITDAVGGVFKAVARVPIIMSSKQIDEPETCAPFNDPVSGLWGNDCASKRTNNFSKSGVAYSPEP